MRYLHFSGFMPFHTPIDCPLSARLCSEATLLAIMRILAQAAAKAPTGNTRASFLKFSTEDTMHVSKHPALMTAPCLLKVPGLPT